MLNGIVRIPTDRLSENARRQLVELLAGLASHPDAIIRLAVLQRFIDMPVQDSEGLLLQTSLRSLTAASPDERRLAAQVIAANATSLDAPAIAAAVANMGSQRRALYDFASVISVQAATNAPLRRRLTQPTRAILDAIRSDPITAGIRLALTAAILGLEDFEQELKSLSDSKVAISAVVAEAIAAIKLFGQTMDRAKLPQLEARLAAAEDPHLRLLAFNALLVQAGDHNRWDAARCSRLNAYRNDPAPLVAIRAQFCFDADPA
jgi:hypothetical protein